MASIVSKKVNGQTYLPLYCLREMARDGGKPKMVSERTRHFAFGDLASCGAVVEESTLPAIKRATIEVASSGSPDDELGGTAFTFRPDQGAHGVIWRSPTG